MFLFLFYFLQVLYKYLTKLKQQNYSTLRNRRLRKLSLANSIHVLSLTTFNQNFLQTNLFSNKWKLFYFPSVAWSNFRTLSLSHHFYQALKALIISDSFADKSKNCGRMWLRKTPNTFYATTYLPILWYYRSILYCCVICWCNLK